MITSGDDPVSLLLDLLEAGSERLPANPVRERFPGPLSYLERIGAVQTDALLKGLEGKDLSPDKKALVGKAKQYYEWFDFLDAYRLATAAAA